MEDQDNQHESEYVRITRPAIAIRAGSPVFVRRNGTYNLIREADEPVSPQMRMEMSFRRLSLYTTKEHRGQVLNAMQDTLQDVIGDEGDVPVAKTRELKSLTVDIAAHIFDAPDAPEVVDAVEDTAATTVDRLYGNQDVVKRIFVMKEHDYTTATHSVNLMAMTMAYCAHTKKDEGFAYQLATAGLLHDIGKTSVDPELLTAARRLSADEFKQIQSHPAKGMQLVLESGHEFTPTVVNVVAQHHEKLDGTGYPEGVTEAELPEESRIVTVMDCYEALTTDSRPYRKGLSAVKALEIILEEVQGGKFDREVYEQLVQMLHRGELGEKE
ncbi:MAG: hypothetical protein CL878_10335 [Dehalococcoidia bacterium]|nr:hypothetical protein [Dehalococcoidia bacterium]